MYISAKESSLETVNFPEYVSTVEGINVIYGENQINLPRELLKVETEDLIDVKYEKWISKLFLK